MEAEHTGLDQASLRSWLRLAAIPRIGSDTQRKLLTAFGLPEGVFAAATFELEAVVGRDLADLLRNHETDAEEEAGLAWAACPGNFIITLADATYPKALLDHPDPPVLIYAKGRIELLNHPAIAVVGSRNATKQGEANADAFS